MRRFTNVTALSVLAIFAAIPAMAQQGQTAGRASSATGACGQTAALTYTLSQPIDGAPVAPLALSIIRSEPMYLEFDLSAQTRLVARTTTPNSSHDPYLTIYTSDGQAVISDDDSAGGYDSMIDTSLSAGKYCAQVRTLSGLSEDTVATTLTIATGDAAEELSATATSGSGGIDYSTLCTDETLTSDLDRTIGTGFGTFEVNTNITAGARQDWRFNVAESIAIQAMTNSDDFDTVLTLVDAEGGLVMENDDGAGGTNSQIITRLEPGSYCISLSGYDGESGAATLTITDDVPNPPSGPVATACTEADITQNFSTAIAPGIGTITTPTTVGQHSRSDWKIEVTETTELQIDSKSSWFDTMLNILDADGNIIAENDDGPLNTDSRITRTFSPGTYCIAIGGYQGEGGDAELVISDTPEADPVEAAQIPGCSDPAMTTDLGTPLNANTGSLSQSVSIEVGKRQDWTVEVAEEVTLRLDATSREFDTTLRISDMDGNLIIENDDITSGTGTNSRIETMLNPGNYCFTLEGFAGSGGQAELALLTLNDETRGQLATERGETLPEASLIEDLGALDTSLQSSAMTPEQTRWLAFTLNDASMVKVNAVSASGDFTLRLFDESGAVLSEIEGEEGLSPSTLEAQLEPGRYIIGMAMNDGVEARLRNILITRE